MDVAIVVSVALALGAIAWNKWQSVKRKKENDRQNVLRQYLELRRTNKTSGLDGLRRAGVVTLKSDSEIRKLVQEVVQHGHKNPLGSNPQSFDDIDLKLFFNWTVENKVNFFKTPLQHLIKEFTK